MRFIGKRKRCSVDIHNKREKRKNESGIRTALCPSSSSRYVWSKHLLFNSCKPVDARRRIDLMRGPAGLSEKRRGKMFEIGQELQDLRLLFAPSHFPGNRPQWLLGTVLERESIHPFPQCQKAETSPFPAMTAQGFSDSPTHLLTQVASSAAILSPLTLWNPGLHVSHQSTDNTMINRGNMQVQNKTRPLTHYHILIEGVYRYQFYSSPRPIIPSRYSGRVPPTPVLEDQAWSYLNLWVAIWILTSHVRKSEVSRICSTGPDRSI